MKSFNSLPEWNILNPLIRNCKDVSASQHQIISRKPVYGGTFRFDNPQARVKVHRPQSCQHRVDFKLGAQQTVKRSHCRAQGNHTAIRFPYPQRSGLSRETTWRALPYRSPKLARVIFINPGDDFDHRSICLFNRCQKCITGACASAPVTGGCGLVPLSLIVFISPSTNQILFQGALLCRNADHDTPVCNLQEKHIRRSNLLR